MPKRPTGALLVLLSLTAPCSAWGTDIYVERAAMAEAGRHVCHADNHRLAARYRDRAGFFTGLSPEAIHAQVEKRRQVLLARLVNASARHTFCARIRGKDF